MEVQARVATAGLRPAEFRLATCLQKVWRMCKIAGGNTNCLAGIRCPTCGSYEPFDIVATVVATVTDNGVTDERDTDWDDQSDITCCACHTDGTVKDFKCPKK